MAPGARLVIVDFAPHDLEELREYHAHRRLGFSEEQISSFLARAGLKLEKHQLMPPPRALNKQGLTVSFWLARLGKAQDSTSGLERMTA